MSFLNAHNLTSKCSSLSQETKFMDREVIDINTDSKDKIFKIEYDDVGDYHYTVPFDFWKYSDHRFFLNRQEMWKNKCELYKQYFRNKPSSDEEENYPLAYIFIVNEHLEALEELLQIFVRNEFFLNLVSM